MAAIESIPISVRYAETDQMGIAYYGVYPVWFEVARTGYMARRGLPYHEIERRGVVLPVSETYYRLIAPARYGDDLLVDTWLAKLESRRVTFAYEVRRDRTLLATGWTKLVSVDAEFKPHRFPSWVTERMGTPLGERRPDADPTGREEPGS